MYACAKIISGVIAACLAITRHSLALIGLAVAFAVMALAARPQLREAGEAQLMNWLQGRQARSALPDASSGRAMAGKPDKLPREQAAVAFWLSKKYHVAPEPLSMLVAQAYDAGAQSRIDPTLILAIMAIESGFNPFAQSAVGAQGLMQVMTRVHSDKYRHFGGQFAAFDPVSNLRVGVKVLQECIARAGSIEGGLRHYAGSANMADDGGYAARIKAEHLRLREVASAPALPLPPRAVPTAARRHRRLTNWPCSRACEPASFLTPAFCGGASVWFHESA